MKDEKDTRDEKDEKNEGNDGNERMYELPLEMSVEVAQDFGISKDTLRLMKVGAKRMRGIFVPAFKAVYEAYMRPLWREAKRDEWKDPVVSVERVRDEYEMERRRLRCRRDGRSRRASRYRPRGACLSSRKGAGNLDAFCKGSHDGGDGTRDGDNGAGGAVSEEGGAFENEGKSLAVSS